MKRFLLFILAIAILFAFAGCGRREDALEQKADAIEENLEQKVNEAANALTPPKTPGQYTPVDPSQLITPQQAQDIALEHAGVTAEEVTGLHTVMDIDNGRQEYDVEFRVGHLEYEYEIDAATGQILSTEIDD